MTDTIVRQPTGIPAGGQFAATAHAEPGISIGSSPATAALGKYQVSAPALHAAREVWAAVKNEREDYALHEAACGWARDHGYEAETWDTYEHADQAHGSGVVLVHSWGAAVTLSGQGIRNFSVDLDGDGDSLDKGDDDGSIAPVTFIYVPQAGD